MSYTISGAKAFFSMVNKEGNAIKVAYSSNCTYTVNHNLQAIELLGQEHVDEHAELGVAQVEFSCTMFKVYQRSAVTLGLQPLLSEFLKQKELQVTIYGKTGSIPISPTGVNGADVALFTIAGVKLTSRSGTVDARGMFTETLNFVGIIYQEEDRTNPYIRAPGI